MFDGKDRSLFKDWAFKLELYIIDNTYDHGANILTWSKDQSEEITEMRFDTKAESAGWKGRSNVDHKIFA